jgi:hypothetical protein
MGGMFGIHVHGKHNMTLYSEETPNALSQSSGAVQALEKTPAHVKAVYMRGTIGLQDHVSRHVLATHRRRAYRVVELEQCECRTYKCYYE